ncbi:hypothetical protein FNJ88_02000 [Chryseobacterium sp. SNU WT5]|uniref:hypothetical protein n=1 Tax=Chryseobacterium sp. SNU WT5 TaxID=2594269 RepID=UPI00117BE44F|nr:hypothetical protein [Chryseobacterium sp. SNU WT5]QDP84386.1 hypothetical protein FNJ88_02000 [Chryseobacterium sp. SNU WT5]
MDENNNHIRAIRLMRDAKGESYFDKGTICTNVKINSKEFWFANEIDTWQLGTHTAPRKQIVVTLSGKLKFKTSDEKSFVLEPGIILLAEDTEGEGHVWKMSAGYENWQRIYIPLIDESDTFFIKD